MNIYTKISYASDQNFVFYFLKKNSSPPSNFQENISKC